MSCISSSRARCFENVRVSLRTIAEGREADHALAVRLLIDFGELESAVADMLFPNADDVSPGRRPMAPWSVGHRSSLRRVLA